jgi:predicted permease
MDLPIRIELTFDWRVFAYIAAIALGAGVAVGLMPAVRAARADLNEALREGGRGMADGRSHHRFRSVLVVGQVAVSLVLLVAAGLFVRSVQRARSVDLGFRPEHVLNVSMDVSQQAYTEARGRAFFRDVEARVRALPGVDSVSYAFSVPFGYYNTSEFVEAEGRPVPSDQRRPIAGYNAVGPDYFVTMGVPIVKGRGFRAEDDERAPHVAVVNELMAARFWPGEDPIGKRFRMQDGKGEWLEVVGVSKSGKYSYIFEDPRLYFFVPIEQQYRPMRALHVRSMQAAERLAPAIQKEIRVLDPDLPLYDVRLMTRVLDGPNGFFLLQMGALFGGGLGLLGLVLALVGIYGVVSYTASRRTQEIGVRMALGAEPRDIVRLVVGHGLLLVAVGIVVGLAAAAALARLLQNLLFGVSAVDPLTFIAVPVVLGTMAALASYLPALRATRVEPMLALRQE